jgi:hypothetical protein
MLVIAITCVAAYHRFLTITLQKQVAQLMEDGCYDQAKLIYMILDDDENAALCDSLILERSYQQGVQLMDDGQYDEAQECLASVGDYKDAQTLSANCGWQDAISLGDVDRLMELYSFYSSLGGAEDVVTQISAALYEESLSAAGDFDLELACQIWSFLGDYENSETLLWRGERAAKWAEADSEEQIINSRYLYTSGTDYKVYQYNEAFAVIPDQLDSNARYFIYYPGGREEELAIDYLLYYLVDPSPNTIAVFMRQNGLSSMKAKTHQAIDLLEQLAAESGSFVQNLVTVGSSLGAYPAMHAAIYAYDDYSIMVDCALSLDAGSDWEETGLLLSDEECEQAAQLGTEFYLFESIGVGMNREGIRRMVNAGDFVTMVGCVYDGHVEISLDAMGMGVMEWAVTDRSENCNPDWYKFVVLEPDE